MSAIIRLRCMSSKIEKMPSKLFLLVLLLFTSLFCPALARNSDCNNGVSAGVVVHAKPQIVVQSIRNQRIEDPGGTKELSRSENEILVEETFFNLPVIGRAMCTYKETYRDNSVEYKMVTSNRFKSFQGSWTLKPDKNGSDTYVELSSFVDTGLCVPMGRQITNFVTLRDVKERLLFVKHSAERAAKVALSSPAQLD